MPGSLGISAIRQALQTYALWRDLGRGLRSPYFTLVPDNQVQWKYRGQIVPADSGFHLEAHIKQIERQGNSVTLLADASLWKDELRIYEVENVGVRLAESWPGEVHHLRGLTPVVKDHGLRSHAP